MKWYYTIGITLAALIFVFTGSCAGINSCKSKNAEKDRIAYNEKKTAIVRYYLDDDLSTAEVYSQRVVKGKSFTIEKIPTKEGYVFVGLYDRPDYATATCYVRSDGTSAQVVSGDVLLYCVFNEA